ncbi:2'-5' RNA ligase [hydrothermal vent metagenome]|uniref:2'-5' RNA ligase n=1 Tax=hydrothermal vent metagenome TaxID=652676 RepID=A0A3B1BU88_9ZZZZ
MSEKGKEEKKEVKRLFFAVDLPDETLARAGSLIDKFGIPPAHVRFVHMENLHISIKFLGDVEVKTIASLCKIAKEAVLGFGAMLLTIEGMGLFPNHTKPRVVWFGVGGETDKLARLESKLAKNIECLGFPADERPFTPHLTIGRVKSESARGELIRLVHNNRELKVGDALMDAVHLYESRLGPGGSVYTKVESFPLSGAS